GVGLAAVEVGKLLGATVIAAASSEDKLDVAKTKGADHLVLYAREPFRDAVKRVTDGRGVDVVFDPVGGEVFESSLRCIAWGARVLVVGFTGGIGLARTNLVLIKGASVLGVRAGEAVRKNPELGEVRLKALTAWAEAGKIRPHISHRLPLEDCAQAMRLLIDRKAIGRVALVMRGCVNCNRCPASQRTPGPIPRDLSEVRSGGSLRKTKAVLWVPAFAGTT